MNRRWFCLLLGVALILAGALSIGARSWWGAKTEVGLADEAVSRGRPLEAVLHYEKAILWRAPVGGHEGKALKALEGLGRHQDPLVRIYAQDALAFCLACAYRQQREKAEPLPHALWSAAVGLSLLGWVGAAFSLLGFGLTRDLAWRKRPFCLSLGLLGLFVLLWIFAIGHL